MAFPKLVYFQFKLYLKNTYFVNLVLTTTTMMLLYQYLAHYVNQSYSGKEWLIAGVMGMWASCTTSAGALGFQKYQGTLSYLLNTAISQEKVLLATISPAAIYGLVAFPLAGVETLILQMPIKLLDLQLFVGVIVLWFTAIVLSYFISLLFVLSRNAIEYEELLLLPILILSGLLRIPDNIYQVIKPFQMLSPLSLPIHLIYHQIIQMPWLFAYIGIVLLFIIVSKLLTSIVIQRAFKEGSLNIF